MIEELTSALEKYETIKTYKNSPGVFLILEKPDEDYNLTYMEKMILKGFDQYLNEKVDKNYLELPEFVNLAYNYAKEKNIFVEQVQKLLVEKVNQGIVDLTNNYKNLTSLFTEEELKLRYLKKGRYDC
jgi:hypothetical protein